MNLKGGGVSQGRRKRCLPYVRKAVVSADPGWGKVGIVCGEFLLPHSSHIRLLRSFPTLTDVFTLYPHAAPSHHRLHQLEQRAPEVPVVSGSVESCVETASQLPNYYRPASPS